MKKHVILYADNHCTYENIASDVQDYEVNLDNIYCAACELLVDYFYISLEIIICVINYLHIRILVYVDVFYKVMIKIIL